MTAQPLPPGTRPGTGGYTAQLPGSAGTVGQSRRVASVSSKHHVEEWYTPVTSSDIADAVSGLATENYVDSAIDDIALPTRDSLGLGTDDAVVFNGLTVGSSGGGNQTVRIYGANANEWAEIGSLGTSGVYIGSRESGSGTKRAVLYHGSNLYFNTGGIGYGTTRLSISDTGNYSFGVGNLSGSHVQNTGVADSPSFASLFLRDGANPQELQIYEQYTSDSNRSYLSIRAETGGHFVIEPKSDGAALRNMKFGGTGLTYWPNAVSGGERYLDARSNSNGFVWSARGKYLSLDGSGNLFTNNATQITGSNGNPALIVTQGNAGWGDPLQIRVGSTVMATISTLGHLSIVSLGAFGTTPPASQPATPADLPGVIAILQQYGLCA